MLLASQLYTNMCMFFHNSYVRARLEIRCDLYLRVTKVSERSSTSKSRGRAYTPNQISYYHPLVSYAIVYNGTPSFSKRGKGSGADDVTLRATGTAAEQCGYNYLSQSRD